MPPRTFFVTLEMKRNNLFIIDLLDARIAERTFDYDLDDAFFAEIGGVIDRGQIRTHVDVSAKGREMWEFRIHSEGAVVVPCDRCLADLELRIDTTDTLHVRLGDTFDDDGEVITVPQQDGRLDLALPIYELIALSMPLKRVHEPGNCDPAMMARISEHLSARSGEDEETDGSEG